MRLGGFGSGVLELLAQKNIKVSVLNIGIDDQFVLHGKKEILFKDCQIDAQSAAEKIKERLK